MVTAPIDSAVLAALEFDEVIHGTGGWDQLYGTAGRDRIIAGNGSDTLHGRDGDDLLEGGNGNDRLLGGLGDDILLGGTGDDQLEGGMGANILEGGAGDDTYILAFGTDSVFDSEGENDVLVTTTDIDLNDYLGSGIDHFVIAAVHPARRGVVVTGTDGDDSISGSGSFVVLDGGAGNDRLGGADGSSEIFVGGLGRDVMDSGPKDLGPPFWGQHSGIDRFDFVTVADSAVGTERDVIYNFLEGGGAGGDIIHLGRIDANTLLAGNQAFTHIGDAEFSGTAGELRVVFGDEAQTFNLVSGDVDGDGLADFEIEVHTHYPGRYLAEDSFIL